MQLGSWPSDPGAPEAEAPGGAIRAVEVAVDAAGRCGDRTYTYLVPDTLRDLEPGEAVLVEFGRRQALGIVVAEATTWPATGTKPIVDRVRADGPLLPRLTLTLAAAIARHYLAPPALVLRAMLPPGLLERLELVAELAPDGAAAIAATSSAATGTTDGIVADLLLQLERGPRPVRDRAAPDRRVVVEGAFQFAFSAGQGR